MRSVTTEEQKQLNAYLRKAVCQGLDAEDDRKEMQQEMWLCLLECGILENEILIDGKLSTKVRKKIANELPNRRERLFYRHRKREKQEPIDSDLIISEKDENVSTAKPKRENHSEEHYQAAVQDRSQRIPTYGNQHHNYIDEFRFNLPFVAQKLTKTEKDVVDALMQDYATHKREGDGEKKRDYVMRKSGVNEDMYKQIRAKIILHFECNGYRSSAHSSCITDSFADSSISSSLPNSSSVRLIHEEIDNGNPSYLKNNTSETSVASNSNGDRTSKYGGTKPEKSKEYGNNKKACEWLEESGLLKQFKRLEDVEEFLNWLNMETWLKRKNETYGNGIPYKPENTKALFMMEAGCCGRKKTQHLCNEPPTSFFCWACGKEKSYADYPNTLAGFLLSVIERHVMPMVRAPVLPFEVLERLLEGWKVATKVEAA